MISDGWGIDPQVNTQRPAQPVKIKNGGAAKKAVDDGWGIDSESAAQDAGTSANAASGIRSANDVPQACTKEQLADAFHSGELIITSDRMKIKEKDQPLSYAEYKIDSRDGIDPSYVHGGDKVRTVITSDPLYMVIISECEQQGADLKTYDKETIDDMSGKLSEKHSKIIQGTSELLSKCPDVSSDKSLTPEQTKRYKEALDKYSAMAKANNEGNGSQATLLRDCVKAFITLYNGVYATDIASGKLPGFNYQVYAYDEQNGLNAINKIKYRMDVNYYGRGKLEAQIKQNRELLDALKANNGDALKTLYDVYGKELNFGPASKEEYDRNVKLFNDGKLRYGTADSKNTEELSVARETEFASGGNKITGYLICSDKDRPKILLEELNLSRKEACDIINTKGIVNFEDIQQKLANVERDGRYESVVNSIMAGSTVKTTNSRENDEVLQITKEYLVLKEMGLLDALATAKNIESMDKRNNNISIKYDANSNFDLRSIKVIIAEDDIKLLNKIFTYLGYLDEKSIPTDENTGTLLLEYVNMKPELRKVVNNDEKTKQVEISVNRSVINSLLQECETSMAVFADAKDNNKVYVMGKKEKVLIPIEGFTVNSLKASYKNSSINIKIDGRDLILDNPTYVFKLYLHVNKNTPPPVIDGVYKSDLTAVEVRKFAELRADNKEGTEAQKNTDLILLKKLARYIETGRVVVDDIYKNVRVEEGREIICKEVNDALSIIRNYYENTVSRNIEIVADGEQQELAEKLAQGEVSFLSKAKAFSWDCVRQLFKFPSPPAARTVDAVADETILAIKENLFTKDEVESEYFRDPNVDAKFIEAFVEKYGGLLNTSIVLTIFGMEKEKMKGIHSPAKFLLNIAKTMKENEKFNIHFGRKVLPGDLQTAKVILQGAIQLFKPGLKSAHTIGSEMNAAKMQVTQLTKGIAEYPYALSLKGYLVLNNLIDVGSISLNDEKVNGTVISAAAKDFRKFINDVLFKMPEEDALKYLDMAGLEGKSLDDVEDYCKVMESYADKPVKEFDFTYEGNGADKKLICALKVYTRVIVQIQNSSRNNGAENPMNIAVETKKLIGWSKDSVRTESVKKIDDSTVLRTTEEQPLLVRKDIGDALKGGGGQYLLFKFIMESMIQVQMQYGLANKNRIFAKARADGDPFAEKDAEDAAKEFTKTRISFIAFMLNPVAWVSTLYYQAMQRDPTALVILYVTHKFILHTTGNLVKTVANKVNRYGYRSGKDVSMGEVTESAFELRSVDLTNYSEKLQKEYSKIRQELVVRDGVDGKLLPEKISDMPGYKDVKAMIVREGSKVPISIEAKGVLRTAAGMPGKAATAVIDPFGTGEVYLGGPILKLERLIGKPLNIVKNKAIELFTKRGQFDPNIRVEEASLQEVIIDALKNPDHDFTLTFNHNNWLVKKTAGPLRKAYYAVERNPVGAWFLRNMNLEAPDAGNAAITLKGWQIAQILASDKRGEVIKVLGSKLRTPEEKILLSNLAESTKTLISRADVIEYLNRNLGWDFKKADYGLNEAKGWEKLAKDIHGKINEISKNGEEMHKLDIATFKASYEYAANNPLSILEFDVGFAEKYGLELKITGLELCTLIRTSVSPFVLDLPLGAGPRTNKKYCEVIENIRKRNPWLDKYNMNSGLLPEEREIYKKMDEAINLEGNKGQTSRDVIEQRMKKAFPIEYASYEKIKNLKRCEELKASEASRGSWSFEDTKLYDEMSAMEKFYEVESGFSCARIIDISKNVKPIQENCEVQPGEPPVIETEDVYKIGDKMFDKKDIDAFFSDNKANNKAYVKAHNKYIKKLSKADKALYSEGIKVKQVHDMSRINATVTGSLMKKFSEAFPGTVTGTILVANPQKIEAIEHHERAERNTKKQKEGIGAVVKAAYKASNAEKSEAKPVPPNGPAEPLGEIGKVKIGDPIFEIIGAARKNREVMINLEESISISISKADITAVMAGNPETLVRVYEKARKMGINPDLILQKLSDNSFIKSITSLPKSSNVTVFTGSRTLGMRGEHLINLLTLSDPQKSKEAVNSFFKQANLAGLNNREAQELFGKLQAKGQAPEVAAKAPASVIFNNNSWYEVKDRLTIKIDAAEACRRISGNYMARIMHGEDVPAVFKEFDSLSLNGQRDKVLSDLAKGILDKKPEKLIELAGVLNGSAEKVLASLKAYKPNSPEVMMFEKAVHPMKKEVLIIPEAVPENLSSLSNERGSVLLPKIKLSVNGKQVKAGLRFGAGLSLATSIVGHLMNGDDFSDTEVKVDIIKSTAEGSVVGAVWSGLLPLAGKLKVLKVLGGGVIGGLIELTKALLIDDRKLLKSSNKYIQDYAGSDISWRTGKGAVSGAAFLVADGAGTAVSAPLIGPFAPAGGFVAGSVAAGEVDAGLEWLGNKVINATGKAEEYKLNIVKEFFRSEGVDLIVAEKPSDKTPVRAFADLVFEMEKDDKLRKALRGSCIKEIEIQNIDHLTPALVEKIIEVAKGLEGKEKKVAVSTSEQVSRDAVVQAKVYAHKIIVINEKGEKRAGLSMDILEYQKDPLINYTQDITEQFKKEGVVLECRNGKVDYIRGINLERAAAFARELKAENVTGLVIHRIPELSRQLQVAIRDVLGRNGKGPKTVNVERSSDNKIIIKIVNLTTKKNTEYTVELNNESYRLNISTGGITYANEIPMTAYSVSNMSSTARNK